jgi:hypothetical protein
VNPTLRFKLLVGAALAILALGNGIALTRSEHDRIADRRAAYRQCLAANQAAIRARSFLQQITSVGDPQERALWRRFIREVPAGVVPCRKP